MKKIISLLFVLPFLLASCTTDGYRIKGEYPGAEDGTKVYIAKLDAMFTFLDSAVVEDGRFEFEGKQDTPVVRMLLSSVAIDGGPVVIENGKVRMLMKGGCLRGGTPLNEDLQAYMDARGKMQQEVKSIVDLLSDSQGVSDAMRDSLSSVVAASKAEFVKVLQRVMGGNLDNALGAFLLTQSQEYFTDEELQSLISMVPAYLRDERFQAMSERVNDAVQRKVRAMATGVGGRYINFEIPNENGEKVIFSNIVNSHKYTLLDFWASWCAPCRQEMPAVKQIYNEFKRKGVAVVSLSLDNNEKEWKEALASLGMEWVQLCDPTGGSAEVASAYGVEYIPTMLLISKSGEIVMRGEPAPAVYEKLKETLK